MFSFSVRRPITYQMRHVAYLRGWPVLALGWIRLGGHILFSCVGLISFPHHERPSLLFSRHRSIPGVFTNLRGFNIGQVGLIYITLV